MRWLLLGTAVAAAGLLSWIAFAWLVVGRTSQPTNGVGAESELVLDWLFEAPHPGAVVSTPCVTDDAVYVAAIRDASLWSGGVVYRLNRTTGDSAWSYDADGTMLHTASNPCVRDGRLYVGEGMHANFSCKLHVLDGTTGRPLWQFPTTSHIESSPEAADGRVYFGAGDDGVYCLDAVTGKERWRFHDQLHVDTSPAVVGGRVYVGAGGSRRFPQRAVVCLDAVTGARIWQTPTDLPAWGSPVVNDGRVYFGLGNGRLTQAAEPPEKPAGALLCVDADTGKPRWRYDVPDAVFCRPLCVGGRITFGSRDGHCHCIDTDGNPIWQLALGGPVMASPVWHEGRLYAVGTAGRVCRIDPDSGRELARFDIAAHSRLRPQIFAAPLAWTGADGRPRLLVATELKSPARSAAVVYCLRDESP